MSVKPEMIVRVTELIRILILPSQYVGCLQVLKSMRTLPYDLRQQVTRYEFELKEAGTKSLAPRGAVVIN